MYVIRRNDRHKNISWWTGEQWSRVGTRARIYTGKAQASKFANRLRESRTNRDKVVRVIEATP